MAMPWFPPLALALGVAGTRTALAHRRHARRARGERDWILLAILSWIPMLVWFVSAFVAQEP